MKIEILLIFFVMGFSANSVNAQERPRILRTQPTGDGSATVQAQEDTERLANLPDGLRIIRERQLLAARDQGVELNFRDEGNISQTSIRGVPLELQNIRLMNEDQVSILGEILAPLFGFAGSEMLIFRFKSGDAYVFEQKINGLPVDGSVITIAVGTAGEILAIRGTAILERNFDVEHALDEHAAVEEVRQFIKTQDGDPGSNQNVAWQASLVYKRWDNNQTLAPWWLVSIPRHGIYYVDPDGAVSSAIFITP